jgi:hypothetical protein
VYARSRRRVNREGIMARESTSVPRRYIARANESNIEPEGWNNEIYFYPLSAMNRVLSIQIQVLLIYP